MIIDVDNGDQLKTLGYVEPEITYNNIKNSLRIVFIENGKLPNLGQNFLLT